MKKFVFAVLLAATAITATQETLARPLGGGRSIGRQSPTVARQAAPAAAPAQAPAAAPAVAPAAAKPAAPAPAALPPAAPAKPGMWKRIVGGALLGLGLGALFSHLGIGGAMASALGALLMIVLLVLLVLLIVRVLRKSAAPQPAPLFSGYGDIRHTPAGGEPSAFQAAVAMPGQSAPWGVPPDFDAHGFLRMAKSSFLRMQAAWDKGDVQDLREFTTPQVFAELRMQITERAGATEFTDVVTIEAQLLGIETSGDDYLASVKFTGMMKNAPNAPAAPFTEVWNMAKPLEGGRDWLLAGIQQLS
jgi:predicted lipid-binding transport protein (Tim44 family)